MNDFFLNSSIIKLNVLPAVSHIIAGINVDETVDEQKNEQQQQHIEVKK